MEHSVFISYSRKDAAIADAIRHYLEAAGIRCWIDVEGINKQDWAGAIMKGLRQCDIYVIIVSKNSIESAEVAKEVTQATHICKYILPFKVDDEMLPDRLQYHLGPYHWLDAICPPLEARIEELKERILNLSDGDVISHNPNRWRLVGHNVAPRSMFVGREAELAEIADYLKQDHVLFLQGMGGIGKSEIAKGYAKYYADRYDTVLFTGYTSNLLELITGDEINIENLRRSTASGEDAESPEAYFQRKLQVLKDLSSNRTLLIIDNFDVDNDPHLEDVLNGPYDVLVTTRNEHMDYPYYPVGKIQDFEKVRKIFTTAYGRPLPPKDMAVVNEILELVNCHTITVELIAKQMRASFVKPEKMLALLKESGTNTQLKESLDRKVKLTSFDYIKQLFKLSSLNEEEQQVLCYMCLLPYTGMDVSLFGEIAELESFDPVNSLLAKSWLMLNDENDYLMLHPVICDVVKAQLAPTPASCKEFIYGLREVVKDFWFFTVEHRESLAPYVIHLLNNYPVPAKEVMDPYGNFINCAWICGRFEVSIKSSHAYYDAVLAEYGPNTEQSGNAATWLAGAYHNSGDDISAEPYYLEGLNHRIASLGPYHKLVAVSCSKLGRCAYKKRDFETSKKYLDQAMDIFDKLVDACETQEEKNQMHYHSGDTVVEIERMYMEQGKYEKALEYCQLSYDYFMFATGEIITNHEYSLVDLGICHSNLGNYEEAENYLNQALDLNIRLNGEASLQTARTKEALADHYRLKGDMEEASRRYLELEMELERDFGETNPQVLLLRSKREALLA
ncbi:MAG: toll/interleukin-1 receptor domain-containing protein [Eubacterium sp.]|nr:toll/interleukin-1 receptor domain-containing protein [Eubacterium sp.]